MCAVSPNEEQQEHEITINEFIKTQKQFMENMQLMFWKMLLQRQQQSSVVNTPEWTQMLK